MKVENCPFCGHRWIRSSQESQILCPNCGNTYKRREKPTERKIMK